MNIRVPKFMILIVLLAFLSSCSSNPAGRVAYETFSNTSTDGYPSVSQDFVVPSWARDYPSIIEEFQKYAEYLIKDDLEGAFDNNVFSTPDNKLAYNWSCMEIEANIWSYRDFPKAREAFGYALKDLNGNGDTELILILKDYTVLAIFSMSNGMPTLMDAYWPKHRCAILNSGLLYTLTSSGADDWYYKTQKISQDGSELLPTEEFGSTSVDEQSSTTFSDPRYYKVIDGKKAYLSEKEFNDYSNKFPILTNTTASEITKKSGLVFIPLFP